ncbi:hypothetical protein MKEN_00004200 [Mycena kentingensis (nom. inval.)]|nr:hypothetical protein MKEN_00004200 [Mycena kentingensis (nom. inval.)]
MQPPFIHQLPPELLSCIFSEYDTAIPDQNQLNLIDPRPKTELKRLAKLHLLVLAQVCSRWHSVVLSQPNLWNRFAVDAELWESPEFEERAVELLDRCLRRSGSIPLMFDFSATAGDGRASRRLLQMLVNNCSRWRDVYMWLDLAQWELMQVIRGRIPILKCLDVTVNNALDAPPLDIGVFSDAPRLRSVVFSGRVVDIPRIPWPQLKTFKLLGNPVSTSDLTTRAIRQLPLSALPPGSGFILRAAVEPAGSALPPDAERKTSLIRTLELTIRVAADQQRRKDVLDDILAFLALPKLQNFMLLPTPSASRARQFPCWSPDGFSALAARSGFSATLSSLKIVAYIDVPELLAALKGLPRLEDLILSDLPDSSCTVITTDLLSALVAHPNTTPLVPLLGLLSLSTRLEFNQPVLLDVARTRMPLCAEFTYLFNLELFIMAEIDCSLATETLNQLTSWGTDGLALTVLRTDESKWHRLLGFF